EERRQPAELEQQAAEREAALTSDQDEPRQAAERGPQKAEREVVPRPDQACGRDEESQERLEAAGPAAHDSVTSLAQALGCEGIRPAVVASREADRPRHSPAIPKAARSATPTRSAAPTPSQAVQEAQTVSSAASPRSLGPTEIAAARAFTRF